MTRNSSATSVGFISLGCPKNLVDSEHMASVLISENFRLASRPEEADVVIVNTCAFIDAAREEAIAAIAEACSLKTAGNCRFVVVTGCLPQRYGGELRRTMPGVDAFVGVDQVAEIGKIIRELGGRKGGLVRVTANPSALFELKRPRVLFTGGPYAYVKIAEGCNHRCRFCAVPLIRGNYRSRRPDDIVAEAAGLLREGVRELDLVSQDTLSYGKDLQDGSNLAGLLHRLGGLEGKFWIRLLYGHPGHVTDELLEATASVPAVCRYLDLPIQHSHPEMLRAMGRGHGDIGEVIERVRRALPDVTIRTTCLVGYPGETEEHFAHLLNFVQNTRFDHLGVFSFSPQEGTPAFELPDPVPVEVAEERCARIMAAQKLVVDEHGRKRLGACDEVLIERAAPGKPGAWLARSRREAPEIDSVVFVRGLPASCRAGSFVTVRYTAVEDYDLFADCDRKQEQDLPRITRI